MVEKTLDELLEIATDAVRDLQNYDKDRMAAWLSKQRGFPPLIPLGDGRHVSTTPEGLAALREFGRRWRMSDKSTKAAIREAEAEKLAIGAFGKLLAGHGLEHYEGDTPVKKVQKDLMEKGLADLAGSKLHYLPVRVIDAEQAEFNIGPVRFVERSAWLDLVESTAGKQLDWVAMVRPFWQNKAPSPPRPGGADGVTHEDWTAYNVAGSFGPAKWVAVIDVDGREILPSRECAEIAVRVAVDTLGLALSTVDARSLRGPGDRKDVFLDRHFVQRPNRDLSYSSRIDLPHFAAVPQNYLGFLSHTDELRAFAGAALDSFVDLKSVEPKVALHKRWVEAMYWYGQALREPREFIGLVNAGVCLDILAKGSKARGITSLCSALLGIGPEEIVTDHGWSLEKLVKAIYEEGRSKFSHGGELALLQDLPVGRDTALELAAASLTIYAEKLALYTGQGEYADFLKVLPSLKRS